METTRKNSDLKDRKYRRAHAGLYHTAWPMEGGDVWRTQTAQWGGFPADFQAKDLKLISISLPHPMLGVTRNADQVFMIGGMPFYMEGFIVDMLAGNTTAYNPPVPQLHPLVKPYLVRYNPQTGEMQQVELSQGKDYAINYPGGILIHENGYVYVIAQAVLYKIDPDTLETVATLYLPRAIGNSETQYVTAYNGMTTLSDGRIITKCFGGDLSQGWLLQIDPKEQDGALPVLASQYVKVATARMLVDEPEPGVAYAYTIDMTHTHRYRIVEGGFTEDKPWSRRYRATADSTLNTQGNGSTFMIDNFIFPNNSAYLADGVAVQDVAHIFAQSTHHPPAVLTPHLSTSATKAGINYWKILGDPFNDGDQHIIVSFDPTNRLIKAHILSADGAVSDLWERSYFVSAQLMAVHSTDLLYINHFDETAKRDNLVVLRLSTGDELARVQTEATEPTVGIITPGMNEEVYLFSTQTLGNQHQGVVSRVSLR